VIRKDIIVVGGGIAGLTATLSLVHNNKDVLLIEKNETCGGLMNSFTRNGFRFEAGARALVNAGLVEPLIKEFGLDIEILPNPISLGIEDKLLTVDGEHSLYLYADMLKELYPESNDEVDRIVQAIHSITKDMKVLYGVDSPLFKREKKNILTMAPAIVTWMFKYLRTMYRISKMNTPFEDYLDNLAQNQSLKDIIGQHFFRRTPVFFALSYFALYNDYIYPKGGVGAFIQKMVDAIKLRGGEILCETEIVSLDPQNKILKDSTCNDYQYNKMIWAADLKALYAMAGSERLTGKSVSKFHTQKQAILTHKGAESVFTVFLGTDLAPAFFQEKNSGHLFYTPDRRGLNTVHTEELKDLLSRWESVHKEELYAWLERFCQYNTFEISIPVLRDPDATPPGKTGLIVSALFDYELTCRIRERGWYDDFKKKMESLFIGTLSSSIYPNLEKNVLFSFSATPCSIYERVGSSDGSIVGWSFEGQIPVVTSMIKMAESVNTSLPDIYAAGKWVYSPAGGPTAIMSGRIAAKQCK